MKRISPSQFPALLQGSILFGTGGGGNPMRAQEAYDRLSTEQIALASFEDLADDAIVVTAFGVGSIQVSSDAREPVRMGMDILSKKLGRSIAGIIPVEIGPTSVSMALELAQQLGVPLIDGDIVGGRSTPEVFLETITLFDYKRTPAVVVSMDCSASLVIEDAASAEDEEKQMREFASAHGNQAYVIGYPLTKKQLEIAVTAGTVSQAIAAGESIIAGSLDALLAELGGKKIYSGNMSSIQHIDSNAFSAQMVSLSNETQSARVYIKNENLIVWIDDTPTLTCPDRISMLSNGKPIYNLDLKEGLPIDIVGIPAIPLWRSEKGMKLFSPRTFGYDINPQLI